jgi:imidazolonepropionase-like amidohydrolase
MRRFSGLAAALLLSACATPAPVAPKVGEVAAPAGEYDYDILIKGGTIYDGSGGKPYVADVGVKDGLINAVYPKLKGDAAVEIDARGKAVAPGFIDLGAQTADIARGFTSAAPCRDFTDVSDRPLAVAVRDLTSVAADSLGLKERGRLMPGWAADVVVFEAKGSRPGLTPVEEVIMDGALTLDHGRPTGLAKPRAPGSCG